MRPMPRRHAVVCAALVLAVGVSGCSSLKALWPWHHSAPPPPPPPAHALDITGAAADGFPQHWQRNTLVVDLSAASGSGSITLKPVEGVGWPLRLAFRVTPGSIGALEVRAAQRTILPITAGGGKPVDLELAPGIYAPGTPEMTVAWGPGTTALP